MDVEAVAHRADRGVIALVTQPQVEHPRVADTPRRPHGRLHDVERLLAGDDRGDERHPQLRVDGHRDRVQGADRRPAQGAGHQHPQGFHKQRRRDHHPLADPEGGTGVVAGQVGWQEQPDVEQRRQRDRQRDQRHQNRTIAARRDPPEADRSRACHLLRSTGQLREVVVHPVVAVPGRAHRRRAHGRVEADHGSPVVSAPQRSRGSARSTDRTARWVTASWTSHLRRPARRRPS